MKKDFFVSYSHIDEKFVKKITKILINCGRKYFLDEKDIGIGDNITVQVENNIPNSNGFIVVLSPASIKSQWVSFEIGMAKALGKHIIPIVTHPSIDVPDYISQLKYATSLEELSKFIENSAKNLPPTNVKVRVFANKGYITIGKYELKKDTTWDSFVKHVAAAASYMSENPGNFPKQSSEYYLYNQEEKKFVDPPENMLSYTTERVVIIQKNMADTMNADYISFMLNSNDNW